MQNGVFSALPLVGALLLHLAVGPVFDWVRAKNWYSVTIVRKGFHAVGKQINPLFLLLVLIVQFVHFLSLLPSTGTLLPAAAMFAVSQLNPDQKYAIIGLITVGYSLPEISGRHIYDT